MPENVDLRGDAGPEAAGRMARRHDPEVMAERSALGARRRKALERFMAERGLKPASWARMAGLPTANTLYNFLRGHTELLSQETMEALVRAVPGATITEMIGEVSPRAARVRLLPCRVEARAGAWREGYESPALMGHQVEVPLPPGVSADEVVRLADHHADEIYPVGAYLAVQGLASSARPLRSGDRVLVHRIQEGRHEVTVRELQDDGGAASLVFRTLNPRRRVPMRVPWPYDGRLWADEGSNYQIRGRVTMMLLLEDDPPK